MQHYRTLIPADGNLGSSVSQLNVKDRNHVFAAESHNSEP